MVGLFYFITYNITIDYNIFIIYDIIYSACILSFFSIYILYPMLFQMK